MNLLHRFLDIIYPPRCPVCGSFQDGDREGAGISICGACLEGFSLIPSPRCSVCGRPFSSGIEDHLCEACLRKRPFYDWTAAPYLYEGTMMEALHRLKYGGKSHLAGPLGALLADFAVDSFGEMGKALVMPVPLHPKRLRERGFNQGLLLARPVARRLGADLDYLSLRRIKDTRSQTGLKSDERRKNVRRAFELIDPGAVKKRTVILVDDVATTGSTLNECARVLRRSGARKVFCLVLARTPAM